MFVLLLLYVCVPLCAPASGHGPASGHIRVMPGHPRDVSVHNRKVQRAAQFAVSELNRASSKGPFSFEMVNVTSAKVQVVTGINYMMEVRLRRVCRRRVSRCRGPQNIVCSFTVTEIPWRHERFVYRTSCEPQKHY